MEKMALVRQDNFQHSPFNPQTTHDYWRICPIAQRTSWIIEGIHRFDRSGGTTADTLTEVLKYADSLNPATDMWDLNQLQLTSARNSGQGFTSRNQLVP
jgi:hypothetical protein